MEIVVSGKTGGALENYEILEGNVAVSFSTRHLKTGFAPVGLPNAYPVKHPAASANA